MQGIQNGLFLFPFVHAVEPTLAQIVVSHKWERGCLIFSLLFGACCVIGCVTGRGTHLGQENTTGKSPGVWFDLDAFVAVSERE